MNQYMRLALLSIPGIVVLAWGGYLWARAVSRAHFEEKERHIRRVVEMTKEDE